MKGGPLVSGKFDKHPGREEKPDSRRKLWLLVLLASLLLIGGGVTLWMVTHAGGEELDPNLYHPTQTSTLESVSVPATETVPTTEVPVTTTEAPPPTGTEPGLPENPVDFPALQKRNDDVYAWLYLPMGDEEKDIDLPILQSKLEEDDNYYLHNNLDREYRFAGELYTQKANAKDFSDRVTVIYGHNMLDGTMFSNLVYFQDSRFFQEHDTFWIYTPGHILTYRIAAAVQFDTRHILNCFDFTKDQVFADWIQNYILEPKTMNRAVREGIEVTIDDKIVILSTCLEHGAYRYLIQGVLISDEPTK